MELLWCISIRWAPPPPPPPPPDLAAALLALPSPTPLPTMLMEGAEESREEAELNSGDEASATANVGRGKRRNGFQQGRSRDQAKAQVSK